MEKKQMSNLETRSNQNRNDRDRQSVGQFPNRHHDPPTFSHNHQQDRPNHNQYLTHESNNPRKPWVMDYQHQQQSMTKEGRGGSGGGFHRGNDKVAAPPWYGTDRDTDGGRNALGGNRMMPHRHHTSISSDSASIGLQSEGVSSLPSDAAIQDQYKEEPNADMYETSDNDRNDNRKITLSPDIQYWFDQKKKIDKLLLPPPEKGTSTSNIPMINNEKTNSVNKSTLQGRPIINTVRVNGQPKANTNQSAQKQQQNQDQVASMNGEQDFNDKHFTKKIFDDGGKISARDLKEAFATFQNKHFSDGVCKFVVRLFDLDRNGGLDIKEFEQLYSYIKLWVSAYHVYDRHHAGYLTEKDFHNALKHMDIHFSPEFISFLVTRCDPINRRISLSQFIVTCVQIQKYTDEFKNRDDNYSGSINLRYEDFLEMILRCI